MAEHPTSQDFEVVDMDDTSPADALDVEAPPQPDTTKGRVFKINHQGQDFLIADFMKGRKWRDVQYTLASLNGEYGLTAMGDAVTQVLGTDQALLIEDYDYHQFIAFGQKLTKVVEALIGKPGK